MGTRSVVAAVSVALVSAGAAIYCYTRAEALHSEARWLLERGNAQALEYAQRLDSTVADEQLKTFSSRRSVMEKAHLWQRGQMLGVMGAALSILAAYMLFLLRRLDSQLDDATGEEFQQPPPSSSPPPPSKSPPAFVPSPHR
ncbi:hypothetical protein [Stigmatella aurantiaca]|uniref:Conserved uncharacterized protein n=1 Tax=Stigmatella aurantiaca (strain DW4/3-1) TaxID=378806 RepID=Q08SU1_STIAD|nr:hypothetical protein [Stigmatella aurantiaca]ADO72907.1 conserved uncharacterized protein [Stigmatella aurantiaca DW4/3-1]EAU63547.1 hypothetical protein STIAU_7188 [Stigmatella aurantiaca DW4/3-1]